MPVPPDRVPSGGSDPAARMPVPYLGASWHAAHSITVSWTVIVYRHAETAGVNCITTLLRRRGIASQECVHRPIAAMSGEWQWFVTPAEEALMKQPIAQYLHLAVPPAEQPVRDDLNLELAARGRIGHASHCGQQAGT